MQAPTVATNMTPDPRDGSSKSLWYFGKRPKSDQENRCRERLGHLVRDVGCFYEINPEKLYIVCLAQGEDVATFCDHSNDANCPFIFWSIDDTPRIFYEGFSKDFGPIKLGQTHQFCSKLKMWFDTIPYREHDKHVVIVLDDRNIEEKLNIFLLVAIASMVLLGSTADEVCQRFKFFMVPKALQGQKAKNLNFRQRDTFSDVSGVHSMMRLTLDDCIHAFYEAMQNNFYNYYEFDHAEYLFYEKVNKGDLNWIIPGKLLAFAGPMDTPSLENGKHPPHFYHDYFNDYNVTTIVRLNNREYKRAGFSDYGFDHFDLIFPDGWPPSSCIAEEFIKIVDEAKGAVAVHCYAGIGRTGTLIAAYIMARYNFTAQMAVAWTRICRPGSVIGDQQDWLYSRFDLYSSAIVNSSSAKQKVEKTKGKASDPKSNRQTKNAGDSSITYEIAEQNFGQAKALVMVKNQRERTDRPCTRTSLRNNSKKDIIVRPIRQTTIKKSDLVLDLGKTLPWGLMLSDFANLKEEENPPFYHIKDNKYEWRIKFPQPKDIKLIHNKKRDIERCSRNPKILDNEMRELKMIYQYIFVDEFKPWPKKIPVIYYELTANRDTHIDEI